MGRVRILEAAVKEAVAAAQWYEAQRVGLGREFESAILAAIDLLEEQFAPLTPAPGKAGSRGVKRLVLRRFPYDIVVVEGEGDVLILAIAHHSRRPGYWRNRGGAT